MKEEMNNYLNKLLSFKERESRKFISINNIFKSKIFLSFIILYIIYNVFSLSSYIINIVQNPTNSSFVISQIISILLSSIIPIFFARLLILQHINLKKDENAYNPVFKRTLSIVKFAKTLLIFVGIITLICGIYYLYLSSAIQLSDELYEYYYSLGFTNEDILAIKNSGYSYIITSIFNLSLAFSFSRIAKTMVASVILDQTFEQDLNTNTLISIVIISLFALFNLLSTILSLCGIESIISPYPIKEFDVYSILFIIGSIIYIAYMIIGIIILIKIKSAIFNNEGSTNPLYGNDVYTINLDDNKTNEQNK